MENWVECLVKENATLLETMKIIDESPIQFAVVIDEEHRILGTVTDGDIRRGILRGEGLDMLITSIMNSNPTIAKSNQSLYKYKQIMRSKMLKQLPIVDRDNRVIDILFMDKLGASTHKNMVVLMLGGLGTRLRPLTNNTPKPMLKIGNKPILETIVEGFKQYGYTNFVFSVNYKKEVIQDYFQNGETFDVTIEYVEETKRMGTAGALSLFKKQPTEPFFVMNGDLLTQINFEQLMEFHLKNQSVATMCVREFEYQIPYGVIETADAELVSIKEKPIHRSFVNAGIYVLNPKVLEYIPEDEFYDMPALFERLIEEKHKVSVFPIREYWLDIGKMDDFHRANNEFKGS
ncbi:nucleotidyltransferase family protein [Lysinibacillus louembei]|uniref:Nucleotidyltransferase family protein n=1 Tax=Lysinibacillus louembei TaxID=1470088 RepID=A0ABZ0RY41_9BACI|nr:nucleotidyltransferase family protein [Lysinibacillus louembei]WPK12400.1 nucleotidyltransferase family protein [Lysinibacillus louembei]